MILHYLRPSIWIKACAILVSLSFALPYLTWAFEANNYLIGRTILPQASFLGKKLTIPEKFGTMANSFQGNEKTIVCIQDLHCNYEVQKNISNIIHNLVQEHGLNLAAVEGAFGRVNTAKISTFPVKKIKAEVCDYFVKQGKLTGAEYYAVTSKQPIHLEGIETPELYVASEQAVRKFLNAESQGYCYDLREIMEELKANIYNSRLLKFDNKRVAFREGNIDILKYSAYLQRIARRLQVDLSVYPNLAPFLSLKQNFFSAQVDSDQLFQELDKLDASIRQQLYSSDSQRKLDELYTRLDIIERLLNISVSQEELQQFRAQREKYTVQAFINFVGVIRTQNTGTGESPNEVDYIEDDMYILDEYLNKVEEFYRLADERSIHFVDNLVRKMDQLDEKLAVMISGGFHADKVLEELEKRTISYVSLKPRLTRQDVVNPYFSLLQDRKTPLEKLLAKNQTILAIRLKLQDPLFLMQMELLLKPVAQALKLTSKESRQLRNYLAENDLVEVMAISEKQAEKIGILDIEDTRIFKTSLQVDGKNTMILITPDKMWSKRLGRQILAIDSKTIACCGKTINIYSSLPDVTKAVRVISTDQPTAVDLAKKYGRQVQGIWRDLANVFITKAASRIFAQYNRMIRAMPTGIAVALYIIAPALVLHLWPGASADIVSQPWMAALYSQILLWGVIKLKPTWQQAIELRLSPNIFNMAGNGKSSSTSLSKKKKHERDFKHLAKEFDKILVQLGSDLIFVKLMERGAKAIQFNITEAIQPNIKEAFRDIQQGLLTWKVLNNEMVVWPKSKNMSAGEYTKQLDMAREARAIELYELMAENKAYMIELAADTDQTMLLNRSEAFMGVAEGRLLCEINEKKVVLQAAGISDQKYYQNIDEARQKAAEEFEALFEDQERAIEFDLIPKEIAEIENFEKTGHPNTDEMIQSIRQGGMRFDLREDGRVLIRLTGISARDYYQHLDQTRAKMLEELHKHVTENQVFIDIEGSAEKAFSGTQRPNIIEAVAGIMSGKLGLRILGDDRKKPVLYAIDMEPEDFIKETQQLRDAEADKYAAQIKPGQIYMEKKNGQVSEYSRVVWPNVREGIQHILEGRLVVSEEKGSVKVSVVGNGVNYCGRISEARDEYVQKLKKALPKSGVAFIEIYNADEAAKKAGIWPNIDEAVRDIKTGQVIPKITDNKIMLEVVGIKPAEYIKAKIQFRQKSADEFLKLFPKLSQENIQNAIFIGPGSEDKAGAYAAIMFYGLPNYRVEFYQAIKEGRMIWNYENKVLKREVVVYIAEFLKQMTAARQEQADELLRYMLKSRQHTITINTREKKSSGLSKPVKKKKPVKRAKLSKSAKKHIKNLQAKNTINIIEAYRLIMQGLVIPCEQPNKQKALKPVDISRSELLEIVKSKRDESLNQAIPALVAGKEVIEISGRAFTQEELIRGIALEELALSYDKGELQVKLAPVSTDSDKAKIFAPETNMATISEEEMVLITKPKAFTPIPHMSLIPERVVRRSLDWFGRKIMSLGKMSSWAADAYLGVIGPLWETELLRRVISSVSVGVSIWWPALGFAFAHTIIEWLDRARKNGWKAGKIFKRENNLKLKKVFTRQLLLLDLKEFAFRTVLGALYFWPFRWDYPLWAVFGISWIFHSAYNSIALAANSYLDRKKILFRVPLTSLVNPAPGAANKPLDIGEKVIRKELSPEDDVFACVDKMEGNAKFEGKRRAFEITVNTKEQYENLYDLGFRPDEAARTRQLNDLQRVVGEITYNNVSVKKQKTNSLRSNIVVMTFKPPLEIAGTTYSSLDMRIRDKSLLKGRKTLPRNSEAIITALREKQFRVAKWTGPVVFRTISEKDAAQYTWLVTAEEWKALQQSKKQQTEQPKQSKKQKKQKQKTSLKVKPLSGVDGTKAKAARAREEKFTADYKETISEELEYLKRHPNADEIMRGEDYKYFHSKTLQIIKKTKISIKANPDKQLKSIVLWSKKHKGNTDYGNIIKKYYKTLDKIGQEKTPLKPKKLIIFLNHLKAVHDDDLEYLKNITSCYELANEYKIIELEDGNKFDTGFNQVILHVAIVISAVERLKCEASEYLSELEGYKGQVFQTLEEDFPVEIIKLDKKINAMASPQSMGGLQKSLRALSAYYAEHGNVFPGLAKTLGKEYGRLADEQGNLAEKIEKDTVHAKDLDSFFDRLCALTSIDFHALWAQVGKRNKEEYNLLLQGIVSAAKPVFVELGWGGLDLYEYFDLKEIEPADDVSEKVLAADSSLPAALAAPKSDPPKALQPELGKRVWSDRITRFTNMPGFRRLYNIVGYPGIGATVSKEYPLAGHNLRAGEVARQAAELCQVDSETAEFIALAHNCAVLPYGPYTWAGEVGRQLRQAGYNEKELLVKRLKEDGCDLSPETENDLMNFDFSNTQNLSEPAMVALASVSVMEVVGAVLAGLREGSVAWDEIPETLKEKALFNAAQGDVFAQGSRENHNTVALEMASAILLQPGLTPKQMLQNTKDFKTRWDEIFLLKNLNIFRFDKIIKNVEALVLPFYEIYVKEFYDNYPEQATAKGAAYFAAGKLIRMSDAEITGANLYIAKKHTEPKSITLPADLKKKLIRIFWKYPVNNDESALLEERPLTASLMSCAGVVALGGGLAHFTYTNYANDDTGNTSLLFRVMAPIGSLLYKGDILLISSIGPGSRKGVKNLEKFLRTFFKGPLSRIYIVRNLEWFGENAYELYITTNVVILPDKSVQIIFTSSRNVGIYYGRAVYQGQGKWEFRGPSEVGFIDELYSKSFTQVEKKAPGTAPEKLITEDANQKGDSIGGLMPWLKELLVERRGWMSAETYDNWAWLIEAGPMFAAIMIATYIGFLDPAQGASALILVGIQYSWGAFFLGHLIPKEEGRQALRRGQFRKAYKSFTPQNWKNVKIAFGLAVVNILFSFALPLSGVIAFGLVSHYFVNLKTVLQPFTSVSLGEFLNVIGPNKTLLRHPVGKIIYARIYGEGKDLRKAIFGPNFTGWRKDIIVESGLGFAFKSKIVNAAAEKDKTRELLPGDVKFIITLPAWAGKAVKKSLESENIIWRTIARYIAWRINQQFNKYAAKIRRAKIEDLAEIAEIYGPVTRQRAGDLNKPAEHGVSAEAAFYNKQNEKRQIGVFGPQILEILNIIASVVNKKTGSLWSSVKMTKQLEITLGKGWDKNIKWTAYIIQNLSQEQIAKIENSELRLSLQSMQKMLLEIKKQPELLEGVVRSIQKQLMRLKNGAAGAALKLELLNITEKDLPEKRDMAHLLFADNSEVPGVYQQIAENLLANVGENQRIKGVLNFIQSILTRENGMLTAVESAQLKHILARIAPDQPVFANLGQGFLPYQVHAMAHGVEVKPITAPSGQEVLVAMPVISHVFVKSKAAVTADALDPDTLVAVVRCQEVLPDIKPITAAIQSRFYREVKSLAGNTIFTNQFGEMEAPLQHYADYCLAKNNRAKKVAKMKFARSLMSILKHQAQQPGTDIKHYEAALLDLGKYFGNSKMFGRETAVLGIYTSAANKPYKIYIPEALRMGAIHQNALLYSYKKITGSFEMEPNLAARINERRTLRFSFANAA